MKTFKTKEAPFILYYDQDLTCPYCKEKFSTKSYISIDREEVSSAQERMKDLLETKDSIPNRCPKCYKQFNVIYEKE